MRRHRAHANRSAGSIGVSRLLAAAVLLVTAAPAVAAPDWVQLQPSHEPISIEASSR